MWALIIMNIIGFATAGYDKYAAIHKKRRISERSLTMLAICLGGAGVILAFLLFRHKTKHYALFFRILIITLAEYAAFFFVFKDPELLRELGNIFSKNS